MPDSKTWWNRAACEDASWYIATASEPFFERGRRDIDELDLRTQLAEDAVAAVEQHGRVAILDEVAAARTVGVLPRW